MERMGKRNRRASLAVALAVAALAVAVPAAAHMGSTKYLVVTQVQGGVRVVADVDVVDIAYELELPADRDAVMARGDDVGRWLGHAITVKAGGAACRGTAEAPRVTTRDRKTYLSVALLYTCPERDGAIVLRDDAVFDDDGQHESLVSMGETAVVLRAGRREMVVGEAQGMLALIGQFLVEGALHLWLGLDHVLFLLSLILVAGEVAARESLKRAVRDVAVIITGFTIGHSVTLIAAALDWVRIDTRLVESTIALSIVVVAVWNIWKPEMRKGLPWVAVTFGLVHGFGFSNVLRELVIPSSGRIVALLSFNVGIELAQLAIVVAVIGPLAWFAKKSPSNYRRWIILAGSGAIALVASYWFVERAFIA
jgi:hypothetical protein